MSLKYALIASAAVLMATPALAAHHSASKSDRILNHTGPISYAELQQIDPGTGYNARGKTSRHRHMSTAAVPETAANTTAEPRSPVCMIRSILVPPNSRCSNWKLSPVWVSAWLAADFGS